MRAFKYLIPRGLVRFCIVTYRPFWFLSIVLVKDLLLCSFHKEPIIWEKMSLGSCQPDTQRFRCTTYCFSRGLLVNPWRNLHLQICDFLHSVCHVKHNYHDKDESLLRRGYLVFLSGTFERAPPGKDSHDQLTNITHTLQSIRSSYTRRGYKPKYLRNKTWLKLIQNTVTSFWYCGQLGDLCYCYNW